jgi:hypothetical protein
MYQSQEKRAWERGVRLAAIWKGIKNFYTFRSALRHTG